VVSVAAPTCHQGSAAVFCCGCCCSTYLPSRKCGGVLLWLMLHHLSAIKEVRLCFVVVAVAEPTCHQGSEVVFCCGCCCSTNLPPRKCGGVLLWLLLQNLPAIKEVRLCFVVVAVGAPTCHQGSAVVFCCGCCCSTNLPPRKCGGVLLWLLLEHLPAIKEVRLCFVVVAVAAPTCHRGGAVVFC
jgi:hypothetical protein